ncbi:MAG: oxidoreductase [Pelosinus sp.]|jgi:uncharacterized protein YbjT (DUF2867 family)|nr:oxidoreductase [Pelosinus sp.]
MRKKTALVVGATSLVGKELVHILLASNEYEKIIVWVRRSLGIHQRELEEKKINFEMLDTYEINEPVDQLFCCLGTTIKKAGTQEAFKTVDRGYPLLLARKAKAAGVLQFVVISAMGAAVKSKIFYNRTKGEMEEALKEIDLPALHIIRPSLLLGKREEFRMGEQMAAMLTKIVPFLFIGVLKKYKPIPAKVVAYAMYNVANQEITGNHIYESDRLVALNKV